MNQRFYGTPAREEGEIKVDEKICNSTTDLMFDIDPETADFIGKRYQGDVTVAKDFQPMMDSG